MDVRARCCLAVALLSPLLCHAELIPKGKYTGTYRVDRWQQHRFDYLFVHPKLDERLSQHVGLPVEIEVSEMMQPMNPGGAMIFDFKQVRRQKTPVSVELRWVKPADVQPRLRAISADEPITLELRVNNRGDDEVNLSDYAVQLVLNFHVPSQPFSTGRYDTDPLGYWSMHRGVNLDWFGRREQDPKKPEPRPVSICEAPFLLSGVDEEIALGKHGDFSWAVSRQAPVLAPRKSTSWTVKVPKLPANEYELLAAIERRKGADERWEVISQPLLLNVLQRKPVSHQGIKAELALSDRGNLAAAHDIPAKITLTNTSETAIRMSMPQTDGKIDLGGELLCFDKDGRRIFVSSGSDPFQQEKVTIAPGKQWSVDVRLPLETKLVRLAWHTGVHAAKDKDAKEFERGEWGYVFSQHLTLED